MSAAEMAALHFFGVHVLFTQRQGLHQVISHASSCDGALTGRCHHLPTPGVLEISPEGLDKRLLALPACLALLALLPQGPVKITGQVSQVRCTGMSERQR